MHAVLGGCLGAREGAGLHAFLALDAEADECTDLAAELDRLLVGEVAQVRHLDLPACVLVDREGIDHSHGVALPQPLQLGDDLPVKLGMVEAQHDELNGSNSHHISSLIVCSCRRGSLLSSGAGFTLTISTPSLVSQLNTPWSSA